MCLLLSAAIPSGADAQARVGQGFNGLEVESVEVRGLDDEWAKRIVEGLALAGTPRLIGRKRALFYPATLEEDQARVLLYLARHGYPNAQVEPAVSGGQSRVTVVFEVRPGVRVHLQSIELRGFPPAFVVPDLGLAPGEPFSDDDIENAQAVLTLELMEQGHARARVEPRLGRTGPDRVDVVFEATPGPPFTIEAIAIGGVPADLVTVARTRVSLKPGDLYARSKLQRSEVDIRRLRLFRQVRTELKEPGGDRLHLDIQLSEQQHRTVQAGLGVYSDESVKGNVRLEHRNLLGGGHGGHVVAEASQFLQIVGGGLSTLSLLGSRNRGSASLSFRREDEDAYLMQSYQVDFWARRDLLDHLEMGLGARVSLIDVAVRTSSPTLDQPEGLVTSLSGQMRLDRTDDRTDPSRGMVVLAGGEYTPPELGSVTHYIRLESQTSFYRVLYPGGVLATRGLAGVARPLHGTTSLLASKRFFAGGSRSVRGFNRRGLGPRDIEGNPTGGEILLEGSVELRTPLWGPFRLALFVDGGQVWETVEEMRVVDFEFSAGPGFMFGTPIGPLRADLGVRLGPADDRPNRVWHFSVGHPF